MVAEEEMNFVDDMECTQLLKRFKSEMGNNSVNKGDNSAICNVAVGGDSRISNVLRTYKRRKKPKSVSENKSQDYCTELVEVANPLNDPEFEQICQSISSNDGIQKCIRDALVSDIRKDFAIIEKEFDRRRRHKYPPTNTQMVENGFYKEANAKNGIAFKQSFEISTFTSKCRRALLSVVISRKFTSLCKILFENFQGTKDPLDFGTINLRMRNGAYENLPMLFFSDIQQIWRKLEILGTELVSLAGGLSILSKSAYHEQVGAPEHNTVEDGNHGIANVNLKGKLKGDCDIKVEEWTGF